ncbi:hypothetical protein [Consotaella salsifontis]|uniref:hypothetical protein n=1 Tax=Consotaella salsifontis TaxID=1365950 RepID=UPI0010556909|nr:hypothetical protein [Consotaella salsifontis]
MSTPIEHNHTLPLAVGYEDRSALLGLGDREVLTLSDECERWLAAMEEFRLELVTEVAQTEWRVVMSGDIRRVSEARDRLHAELTARASLAAHTRSQR